MIGLEPPADLTSNNVRVAKKPNNPQGKPVGFKLLVCLMSICVSMSALVVNAHDPIPFRTDASSDKSLRWFQLVGGEFPPEKSAHSISGELIRQDHLERRFYLRVDRDDSQQRGDWDLPIVATMLPYGSNYYHGSPAALQDIPLGTHLHGLFYEKAIDDKSPPPDGPHNNRITPDVNFTRCFRLEDDFSHYDRQNQNWRIDAVDLVKNKLTATLVQDGSPIGKPKLFDLVSGARVLVGNGYGSQASLEVGQRVQFNLTWVTLYGPGRILDIWLDETSRHHAINQQLERHRNHIRERGLAGWVDNVDDAEQIVTITFFGGVDPALFSELTKVIAEPIGWPLSPITRTRKSIGSQRDYRSRAREPNDLRPRQRSERWKHFKDSEGAR